MDKRPQQNDREIALRKYFEIVTREKTTILILMIVAGIVFALVGFSLRSASDGAAMAWFCIVAGLGIAVVGGIRLGSIEARIEVRSRQLNRNRPTVRLMHGFKTAGNASSFMPRTGSTCLGLRAIFSSL